MLGGQRVQAERVQTERGPAVEARWARLAGARQPARSHGAEVGTVSGWGTRRCSTAVSGEDRPALKWVQGAVFQSAAGGAGAVLASQSYSRKKSTIRTVRRQ